MSARRPDDRDAARGILNGLALGLVLWAAIVALFLLSARPAAACGDMTPNPATTPPIIQVLVA